MSYTVLARKYRSRTLDEIVGQEPIVTTLTNAITSGRIHHAFLFCGTRGVGKTSTARVLAKSLNCLNAEGPTPTPCGKCDSCQAISEGQDIDVIEIDAASNTGVDHIRELRSNATYRPARARYKIYIIDEVHMLSTGAFNALLKTLEEPPEHVKFIFATTELQKVPATIQSRVLRFEFQSIPLDVIVKQFNTILKAEEIEADEAVIRRVARCANGSMRDGLSLLDRGGDFLQFGGGEDELDVLRGLLQRLEQGVERAGAEHVDFVNDVNLVASPGGAISGIAAQLADVVHAGIAGGVDFDDVNVLPLGNGFTGIAFATRRGRGCIDAEAVQRLGQHAGRRCLAYAACAAEQERVVDPAAGNRVGQRRDDGFLADDFIECATAVLSSQDGIGHVADSVRFQKRLTSEPQAPARGH